MSYAPIYSISFQHVPAHHITSQSPKQRNTKRGKKRNEDAMWRVGLGFTGGGIVGRELGEEDVGKYI